jgi:hypothetical protein
MPVILPPEQYAAWLDRSLTDPARLPQVGPYPSELMESLALAPVVNSVRNDGPECLTPACADALPPAHNGGMTRPGAPHPRAASFESPGRSTAKGPG